MFLAGYSEKSKRGYKVEVIIRDNNWSKIDTLKTDSNNFYKILKILEKKYDIKLRPTTKQKQVEWLSEIKLQ